MKKIITLFISMLALLQAQAQGPASAIMRQSQDFLMVGVSYDTWTGAPDSIHTGGLSRGFNMAFMYDFPLNEGSHLSVAPGLGISSSNIFFKDQTAAIGSVNPTLNFNPDSVYKHYKLATTYLEIPIELRYRAVQNNANTGFKAGLGLKFGALVNAHTKGKKVGSGGKQTDKVNNKQYFQRWRVAATLRVGWGNFAAFTSYSITPLLNQEAGPKINSLSVGICISGL